MGFLGLFLICFISSVITCAWSLSAESANLTCNGYPELCDRRYNEISFLTVHNAQSDKRSWALALLPGSNINNQSRNIDAQLVDGVRAMKMPVHFSHNEPYVCHGIGIFVKREFKRRTCNKLPIFSQACSSWVDGVDPCFIDPARKSLTQFLSTFKDFLKNNPNDVLTLLFEDYTDSLPQIDSAFEANGLKPYLHAQNPNQPWPTLREMIQTNHRLVVFVKRWKDLKGQTLAAYPGFNSLPYFVWSSTHHFGSVQELRRDSPDQADQSQASFRDRNSPPKNKLWLLQHFVTPTIAGNPNAASVVNHSEMIQERINKYSKTLRSQPNFISVDFYHLPGDSPGPREIVNQINGINNRAPASVRSK